MMMADPCLVCGIDEAGRGPVLGPLVMAMVCIKPLSVPRFIEWGIRDSKELKPSERQVLYTKIKESSNVQSLCIQPKQIDNWILDGEGLNALEAYTISKLINPIQNRVSMIYVDSPSTPRSFHKYLKRYGVDSRKVIPEAKADKYRPVVSAASVVAKVKRDTKIQHMAKELGFAIGSGYPSSSTTRNTLPKILKKKPQFVRKSWKTLEKLDLA